MPIYLFPQIFRRARRVVVVNPVFDDLVGRGNALYVLSLVGKTPRKYPYFTIFTALRGQKSVDFPSNLGSNNSVATICYRPRQAEPVARYLSTTEASRPPRMLSA